MDRDSTTWLVFFANASLSILTIFPLSCINVFTVKEYSFTVNNKGCACAISQASQRLRKSV